MHHIILEPLHDMGYSWTGQSTVHSIAWFVFYFNIRSKYQAFWDVTLCHWENRSQCFRSLWFLWSVWNYLINDTTTHPRKLVAWATSVCESQMLHVGDMCKLNKLAKKRQNVKFYLLITTYVMYGTFTYLRIVYRMFFLSC